MQSNGTKTNDANKLGNSLTLDSARFSRLAVDSRVDSAHGLKFQSNSGADLAESEKSKNGIHAVRNNYLSLYTR